MLGISLNREVIDRCVRALRALVDIQADARKRLVQETGDVCSMCSDAYSALLARLVPVKAAYGDPERLAQELRALTGDAATRNRFKPEGLCSQIDHLLTDFQTNLNGVKYSVHLLSIGEIKETLHSMGNYDQALYHQYDRFMMELSGIATALQAAVSAEEKKSLADAAGTAIEQLEVDLRSSVDGMRTAKNQLIGIM